jgi:preprotein translocase subunit SecE
MTSVVNNPVIVLVAVIVVVGVIAALDFSLTKMVTARF